MVDLHAHSAASDGSLSPSELVALAKAEGLSAVALTDHDTVAGLDEGAEAAAVNGVGFVPGIELEVPWETGVFHMLGLGLKRWDAENRDELEHALAFRRERNLKMVGNFRSAGIPMRYEELVEIAGHDTVGRPHFARWLSDRGLVATFQEAFDTMIGDGKPFYERKRGFSVGRTCEIVHRAGGVAVVAHPQTLLMSFDELAKSLKRWKGEGLDGVEAYHPGLSCSEGHRMAALAEELGLMITAGSDFHTPARKDRRLGRSCDGVAIDDSFLEPIGVLRCGTC